MQRLGKFICGFISIGIAVGIADWGFPGFMSIINHMSAVQLIALILALTFFDMGTSAVHKSLWKK